jgi:hypothetical protein
MHITVEHIYFNTMVNHGHGSLKSLKVASTLKKIFIKKSLEPWACYFHSDHNKNHSISLQSQYNFIQHYHKNKVVKYIKFMY